jgi:CzcA family heavy metal efflux pump
MIARTIRFSLENRLLILIAAALLSGWGLYQTARMDVDVFPDLTAPTVTVVAEAQGMAPQEVETLVTFPLETALNGASGVRRVRSSTLPGVAVLSIEFDWGTEIYQARQVVAERLQLAMADWPPALPPPVLAPVTSMMGEILFVALNSDRHTAMELKTVADWTLRRRILAVPGVAEVLPIGGDTRQFQVLVDPLRLLAYRVALDDVVAALRASNENASAGFFTELNQEYLIHGIGRVRDEADIAATVVTQRDGLPILVGDLAEVRVGAAPKRGTASHNAAPAVILGIQKQPDVNTLALTARLETVLADIGRSLPEGMRIDTDVFRQADFISLAIENLSAALRDGAILVIVIVFVFLAALRATLIAVIAIPLSLLAALLAIKATGATINTMTLGGLAIALGALVDDAIIVVENAARRLRGRADTDHRSVREIVFASTREVQGSIVFATLIIGLVFVPLFFLADLEGLLMRPLGFAYVVALGASLLVALTVTPVLCSLALPGARSVRLGTETRLVLFLKRHYRRLIGQVLPAWRSVAVASAALLLAALVALAAAGRAFLPEFNEGSLTLEVVTLPGTPLEDSDRLGRWVEEILLAHPEVTATARRTGRAELDPHAQFVFASEIDVSLAMRDRSKAALLDALRADLTAVPGTNITIGQPISHRIDHVLSGTRANIAVKIFGEDLFELRRLAERVRGVLADVRGAVDVAVEQQAEIPFLSVRFDREAMALHGMRAGDLAVALRTAFAGLTVSRVLEGQSAFDLVVRYPDDATSHMESIAGTLVATPAGGLVPLHAVAHIERTRGPNVISRENVQRVINVTANVSGRDLVGVVDEARARIAADVDLPPGYRIEYGGQFEAAADATRTLLIASAVVIVGIFLLLYLAFRSTRDAWLVMLNLPLALIGGVAGVYIAGGVLSVASIIGIITLFGIATRNGVMLVAHIQNLVNHEGVTDRLEAVRRGAEERLVPILMTALATGLALVPLALSMGQPGSEIQAPMAIVILFGLLSSTALNMIVLPSLYLRFGSAAVTGPSAPNRTPAGLAP